MVIPNLVDTLDPTPNGNNKTVGQAKSTVDCLPAFTGTPTSRPTVGAPPNSDDAITQNRTAYTCANNANQAITIRAQ